MPVRGPLRAFLAVVVGFSLVTCSDEFPFAPEEGEQPLFIVRVEPMDWPASLKIGESSTLRVRIIETSTGSEIASAPGLAVSWRVNGSGIYLDGTTGLENTAHADGTGQATPVVTVSGEQVVDTTYSGTVINVFAAGVAMEVPGQDTVLDARGDTLTLVARGLDVNGDPVDYTGVEWRLSENPVALELLDTTGDTARAAVTGIGADTVYADHGACEPGDGVVCEAQVLVTVDPVAVAMAAAADTVLLDALGATDTAAVVFSDRNGFPVPGVAARWSLVEAADSVVVTLDTLNGAVTALAAGVADVAVTSAVGDDTTTVKVEQRVAATGLDTSPRILEGIGHTDTLVVAPTDPGGNALQRVPTVAWSSTDTTIVRAEAVSGDSLRGVITAIGFGDAWVFVDVEGVVDSVQVTATGVVASVTVTPSRVTATQLSERPVVNAAAYDSLGNQIPNAPFNWESADPAVAEVAVDPDDETRAEITPVANGTTWVRAASGSFVDSAEVVVDAVTAFSCDEGGGTEHEAGTYSASETWTRDGSPHYMRGGIDFQGDGTVLTIEPGALVCVDWGILSVTSGARLHAVGTADERILITVNTGGDRWDGLEFWGTPSDTSRIEHAVIQLTWNGVRANDPHPLAIDNNTLVSQTFATAVSLASRGSRFSNSTVEGVVDETSSGVSLAAPRTRFEHSTIRGSNGRGLDARWADTVSIVGGLIDGARSFGLMTDWTHIEDGQPVRIRDTYVPVRMIFERFWELYPTLADQDSLLGNRFDYIAFHGQEGQLTGAYRVRSDMGWWVHNSLAFEGDGQVTVDPGAYLFLGSGTQLEFYGNATLVAEGTATDSISISGPSTGTFYQLYFDGSGTATDTSRLKYVEIVRSTYGLQVWNGAHVVMDSSYIRHAEWQAVATDVPGFRMTATTIDTTTQVGSDGAVVLWGSGAVLEDVSIVNAADRALSVNADSMTLTNIRIEGAGGIGLHAPYQDALSFPGLRVTGGASYPARLGIGTIPGLEVDSLLGNAKDTLLVSGGRVKGEMDLFGNFTSIDTIRVVPELPWLIDSTPTVDSAAVLYLEPGAVVRLGLGDRINFHSGRLVSAATSSEPARFTGDPAERWVGLEFGGEPRDTSFLRNVILENGANTSYWPYTAVNVHDAPHVVVIDSVTFRQMEGNAIVLNSNGSRILNTVFDTINAHSYNAAVDILADSVLVQNVVVRDPDGPGMYISGAGVTIDGLRIEGADELGLTANGPDLAAASGVRITGGAGYPVDVSITNLEALCPTPADQDSLLGNAKDTLLVRGGRLKGELDVFGTPQAVDTLVVRAGVPWRVGSTITIDSAAVLLPEPGSRIALDENVRIDLYPGRLVAEGTEADPVVITASHPLQQGGGLYFQGTPGDTSYLLHVRLEYLAGAWPNAAVYTGATYPVVLEHVFIKRPEDRALHLAAPGTRVLDVYVDSAGGSASGRSVVDIHAAVTVDSLTVFHPEASGVSVFADGVVLRDVRIEEALGIGLDIDPGYTLAEADHVVVTNGRSYGLQIPPQNLPILAPSRADQDSLMGNALDTLLFYGGTVRGEVDAFGNPTEVDTLFARSDLPWRLTGSITIDSAAVLFAEPGAVITLHRYEDIWVVQGQMVAEGTSTDTIVFRPTHPLEQWGTIGFSGSPPDTSRIAYARFEDGGNDGSSPYYAVRSIDQHPVVLDNIVMKRTDDRAVYLGAPGSRMSNAVVDTAGGSSGGSGTITLYGPVTLENTVVRKAGYKGVYAMGDSFTIRNVRILGSGEAGLYMEASAAPAELSGIRVTDGLGVPVTGPLGAIWMLDQDSLMGNARDTLVFNGGSMKGEVTDGTFTRVDTMIARADLPWRVDADITFDSATVFYVEPGARIEVDSDERLLFRSALLLAEGTDVAPVLFTTDGDGSNWAGLEFTGNPQDTSRIKHAIIEYSGGNAWSEYVALWTRDSSVVVVDSSVIRQSEYRAVQFEAPGSRIQYSVVDTTHSQYTGLAAVELFSETSMHGTLVRGAYDEGVYIRGDNVTVDSSEVTLSGDAGLLMGSSSYVSDPVTSTVEYCNFIDNTGNGVGNLHSASFDALNNWWGDATDGGANWDGVGSNVTYTPFLSAAVSVPWYKPGGGG